MENGKRKGPFPAGKGSISLFLAAAVAAVVACSGKEAVVIGDPTSVKADEREVTPSGLLLNSAGYLEKPAKVRTEFVEVRGKSGDCFLVRTRLGPQDLDLCVNEEKWGSMVKPLAPGTPLVAIGMIDTIGPETAPKLVLRID